MQVTLTTAQLLINQRISQAAVRRANELMARIEDGLVASDVADGNADRARPGAGGRAVSPADRRTMSTGTLERATAAVTADPELQAIADDLARALGGTSGRGTRAASSRTRTRC